MAELAHKKKVRKIMYSRVVIGFLTILCLFFAYKIFGLLQRSREVQKNKADTMRELTELKAQEANLHTEIDRLSTEQGTEEEIRDKFRVVKPGEGLIVIVEPKAETVPAPRTPSQKFTDFWKNLFK